MFFLSQPDEYGEKNCKTCTWSKYPTNEKLSCDTGDGFCQFGVGFVGKEYDLLREFPGDKCFDSDVKSSCLDEWQKMGAQTAKGKCLTT